jgi:hypothetical protein
MHEPWVPCAPFAKSRIAYRFLKLLVTSRENDLARKKTVCIRHYRRLLASEIGPVDGVDRDIAGGRSPSHGLGGGLDCAFE